MGTPCSFRYTCPLYLLLRYIFYKAFVIHSVNSFLSSPAVKHRGAMGSPGLLSVGQKHFLGLGVAPEVGSMVRQSL